SRPYPSLRSISPHSEARGCPPAFGPRPQQDGFRQLAAVTKSRFLVARTLRVRMRGLLGMTGAAAGRRCPPAFGPRPLADCLTEEWLLKLKTLGTPGSLRLCRPLRGFYGFLNSYPALPCWATLFRP